MDVSHLPQLVLTGLVALGGYLLGSIPFGVLVTHFGGAGDIRQVGSGNIGATNVLRTGRRDLAALTLIGDAGKGAVAALLVRFILHDEVLVTVAAAAAFVGHIFPVWLRFRGGKGVATFFGTLLAVAWPAGLAAGATWLLVAGISRFSSLAALTAVVLAPIFVFVLDQEPIQRLWMTLFMAPLVFIRHHENIRRLLRGEEPRIGGRKSPDAEPKIAGHNGGPPLEDPAPPASAP
jgi:glycerol-3-phosphate acyltransferase PlsY